MFGFGLGLGFLRREKRQSLDSKILLCDRKRSQSFNEEAEQSVRAVWAR